MVRRELVLYPVVTLALYLALAFYILLNGHLHEDAYILYIFSESFASGNGIAYFPGGSPAEGATDFLWMILLGVGRFFGLDVAVLATFLNGIGLSAITFFGIILAGRGLAGNWLRLFGLFFALIVSVSQISQASLAGFSAGFYTAFIVAIFYILYERKKELLYLIPVLGITIGLLRPDGVIIGVFASLIGFYFAFKESVGRKYLVTASISLVIGIVYFFWRYDYFGSLLPLPLYVKSASAESLPGVADHIRWVEKNAFLVLMGIATLSLCNERRRILAASIPVGMLFLALMFATQSQNVAHRFQAPGTALLLMWFSILMSRFPEIRARFWDTKKTTVWILVILVLGCSVNNMRRTITIIDNLNSDQYINYLPFHLSSSFKEDTVIALTEAGRFAYWVKGDKYDLVGLNTPEVAIEKSSPGYIDSLDPDLVFMHTDATADFSELCNENFCAITKSELLENVIFTDHWSTVDDGVKRAPLTVYEYVRDSTEDFTIYTVSYMGSYGHVYLLRSGGDIDSKEFQKALELSHSDEGALSYWEMKQARGWSGIFDEN